MVKGLSHDQRIKKGNPRIDSIGPGFFLAKSLKGDYRMRMFVISMLSIIFLTAGLVYAENAGFDDLALDPESYYNGADGAGGFESGGALFNNYYSEEEYDGEKYIYWDSFAYTNTTDTTTLDYKTNQYSAISGSGAGGSTNYGVGYVGFVGNIPNVTFPKEVRVTNADITNTTISFLVMQQGYYNAKKFGGDSGDDADWFLMTITGKDAEGNVVGTIEFYLADFRPDDNSKDYIIAKWTSVDLSGLGPVKSLEFSLSSSDTDPNPDIGMNTPAFFAIDNIEYYETDGSDSNLGCFMSLVGSGLF